MLRVTSLALAALLWLQTPANAAIINWTATNANFANGGSIVGGFTWDTETGEFTDFDISTTEGADPFAGVFDYAGASIGLDLVNNPDRITLQSATRILRLFGDFSNGAFDTAGSVALAGTQNGFYECAGSRCSDFRGGIIGGTLEGRLIEDPIADVPLPASLAGLLVGLGAFGALRRRRKS